MKKRVQIILQELVEVDKDGDHKWINQNNLGGPTTKLYDYEYPNIFIKECYTDDEIDRAINLIITYLKDCNINKLLIDLDIRNKKLEPAKKMTLEEIEEKLGYKVEIIDDVTEDDIPWLRGECEDE